MYYTNKPVHAYMSCGYIFIAILYIQTSVVPYTLAELAICYCIFLLGPLVPELNRKLFPLQPRQSPWEMATRFCKF